jgi:hypothetical protein
MLSIHPAPATLLVETRDDLLRHVHGAANRAGYGVSIKRSTADIDVIIGCVHGGMYRNYLALDDEERRLRTSSRRFDCPFRVNGRRCSDGRWKLLVKDLHHNHEPSTDMSGHPSQRRLNEQQLAEVKRLRTKIRSEEKNEWLSAT